MVTVSPAGAGPDTTRRVRLMPGRLRAEVVGLRENVAFARRIVRVLGAVPGVGRVEANPLTGRVLILYDDRAVACTPLLDLLARLESYQRGAVRRRSWQRLARMTPRPPRTRVMLLAEALQPVIAAALALGIGVKTAVRGHHPRASSETLNALSSGVVALNGYPQLRSAVEGLAGRRAGANIAVEYAGIAIKAFRESVLGLVADAGSSLFSFLEQSALRRAQRRARRLLHPQGSAHLQISDGREITIPVSELQPGEVIRLGPHRRVPADGVIVAGIALIDESVLTNRAFLSRKRAGDPVFLGTRVEHGSLLIRITATGEATRLGQLVVKVQRRRDGTLPIDVAEAIQRVGARGLILAALTFLFTRRWRRAIAVLAVMNPSALADGAFAASGAAVEAAAKENVRILRRGALDALARVDTVLFGKTGTLTAESPAVDRVAPAAGVAQETVLGLATSVLAQSGHPLGAPLLEKAAELEAGLPPAGPPEHVRGEGTRTRVEGATVLVGTAALMAEEAIPTVGVREAVEEMAARGNEVLFVARDGRLVGAVAFRERLLPGAQEAIRGLRDAGIARLGVVTADPTESAARLAAELGIEHVWSGIDDEAKRSVVRRLQREGHTVAVVGASASDTAALAAADVGIGFFGTDYTPAPHVAQILLLQGRLALLPGLVALGRRERRLTWQNVAFGQAVTGVGAVAALSGLLPLAMAEDVSHYLMLALLFRARGLSLFELGGRGVERLRTAGPMWHSLPAREVALMLGSDTDAGLTPGEAERRLATYGLNELTDTVPQTFAAAYVRQFATGMTLLLGAAAGVSALIGEPLNALLIGGVVLVNAALGAVQEYRAERATAALRTHIAPTARCRRGGDLALIPATQLVPGDIVLLQAGDTIPADARIVESHELEIEEAMLTGESTGVHKEAYAVRPDTDIPDRASIVYMATAVTRGRATVIVVATGMSTAVGRIAGLLRGEDRTQTPLQVSLYSAGRTLALLSGLAGLLFVGVGLARRLPLRSMLMGGVTLATAAVPEGLPAIVTIALSAAVQRMSRQALIVRRLSAVEAIGRVTVICCDKTGTLTQNHMAVRAVADGALEWAGEAVTTERLRHPDLRQILTIGAVCNDATIVDETTRKTLGGSTEGALLLAALDAGLDPAELRREYPRAVELPFSTERSFMATVCRHRDRGLVLMLKGAPETIAEFCDRRLERGREMAMTRATTERLHRVSDEMAYAAMRVLAMAYRPLDAVPPADWLERPEECIFAGLVGMSDPLRPEVRDAVAWCQRAGVRVVMATGDHRSTAIAIARELGFPFEREAVVDGHTLGAVAEHEFGTLASGARVFARVTPEQKLQIVRALQAAGETVAMTGDGVNDAPAVKQADVGISMGHTGTEATRQASSIILGDDSFVSIVRAIEEGRGVRHNLKRALAFLIGGNLGETLFTLSATLIGGELPLLPLHLLLVNLFTDGLPVMALAGLPARPGLSEQPPTAALFDGAFYHEVMRRGITTGVAATAVHLLARRMPDAASRRSMTLAGLVGSQLVQAQNWRSGEASDAFFLSSLALSWAALGALTVASPLRRILGTAALAPRAWAEIMGCSLAADWLTRTGRPGPERPSPAGRRAGPR